MRERIKAAIRTKLRPPEGSEFPDHLAALRLSRDAEGRERLLTTNFDTLFERAWADSYHQKIESHAGPAMPRPKSAGFKP